MVVGRNELREFRHVSMVAELPELAGARSDVPLLDTQHWLQLPISVGPFCQIRQKGPIAVSAFNLELEFLVRRSLPQFHDPGEPSFFA